MAKIIVPAVTSTVSDLVSDNGATDGVVTRRVSFEVDATLPAIEALVEMIKGEGVLPANLKVVDRSVRAAGGQTAGSQGEANAVREWALENGITVADRGRIKDALRDAYNAFEASDSGKAQTQIVKDARKTFGEAPVPTV